MDRQYFFQKLLLKKPSAFEDYNYDLLPDSFLAGDYITIECKKHGVFRQKACSHLFSSGCPTCGHTQLTTEGFIAKSKKKFGDKFDYRKTVYINRKETLIVTCPIHGDVTMDPKWHLESKCGCNKCNSELFDANVTKSIIERAVLVHGDKYDYSRMDYIDSFSKIEIICSKHGTFRKTITGHIYLKQGCPRCADEKGRCDNEGFVNKSIKVHGDYYDYSKVHYETNRSLLTITCKKHGDFIQRASSHLYGNGCKKCHLENIKLSVNEFIKKAKEIHGDKYDYSKVVYTGNKTKVEIICPRHGSFWQKPNAHTSSGNGCNLCQESKGERAIEVVLKKYGIAFVREYKIEPHRYRYDFFLPEFDAYIEFNGHQHYRPVEMFGGKKEFLKNQRRDAIKKRLVADLNAKLIVLTYLDLDRDSIERRFVQKIKQHYRYCFVVDGSIRAFRTALEVYEAFGIPLTVLLHDLESVVIESHSGVRLLF